MTAHDLVSGLKNHGLTQVQIAERTGVPQSTISKIERADVKDVMSSTYLKLQALYRECIAADKVGVQ